MISDIIDISAGPAISQLKAFADEADRAAAAMEKLKAGGAGMAGADKMAASMEKAASAIEKAAQRAAASMGRLSTAARGATGGLDEAAGAADKAAASGDRLAASADAGAAALDRQAVAGSRAGKSGAEAAAGGTKFWSGLKTVMLGAGVAAAYGIDKAMKFQSEMLLLHTQAGVSVKDTQKMSQGVLLISTQTGQSLGSVAESAYHVASNMASMGTSVPVMLKAVKVAAEGAAVGHSNLVDTTNAMTAAIASGIPGVKNYQQAMGVLNATVGSGDMSMQDLAEAFGGGMVATVKGYGLTLKDVGAATAVFGDNNIRGAKAGTDLRMAVQALAVPMKTAPLKKFGLDQETLAKDMQKGGLIKALDDLTGRFKKAGLTGKTEGEWITALFGKKAGSGIAVLLEQMDRLHSKYPVLTHDANNFGKAWQATQQSPAQKWKELTAGLQAGAVGFGTELLPAFSKAVGFADQLLAKINATKGGARDMALAFGGIAALFTGKKLVSGIEGAFKTGETALRGVGKIAQVLHIPGLDKLAGIGQGAGLSGAAGELSAAAGELSAAAARLGGAGVAGGAGALGGAKGAAGAEGATAAESAAGGGLLAKLAGKGGFDLRGLVGAANPIVAGIMAGLAIRGEGDKLSPKGTPAGTLNAYLQQPGSPGAPFMNHYVGGYEARAANTSFALSVGKYINDALGIGAGHAAPAGQLGPHAPFAAGPAYAPAPHVSASAGMLGLGGHPAALAAPDLSALTAAKGKAQSAAKAITTAIEGALGKPAKAKAPDLSAYAAAKSAAHADGVGVSQGLASGILAAGPQAVAAAHAVASQVEAAMASALQTHSPSKKTQKIGKDASAGLVVGLEGGKAAVDAAATALGRNVAKAADIASIDATTAKLLKEVPRGDTGLTRMLKADQGKLVSLANQRAKLEAEIGNARQIAQNAISGASIMNAAGYTPAGAGGPLSAYALIQGKQAQAQDLGQFAADVGKLKKMGLNATDLNQIVQAGASAGEPVAQGIASGGKSAIAQLNQLQGKIHSSAAKLGNEGAGPMYQAGVAAGQGLASGIKSEMGAVDSAIKQLAQSMVAAMKHALKSHSPSLVFRDLGLSAPMGAAMGVDAGSAVAEAAVSRMGNRMAGAYRPGAYGHGGRGGGNVTNVTHVHLNVSGHVMTEHDLVSTVQEGLLRRGSNNWQAGLVLPGRRT